MTMAVWGIGETSWPAPTRAAATEATRQASQLCRILALVLSLMLLVLPLTAKAVAQEVQGSDVFPAEPEYSEKNTAKWADEFRQLKARADGGDALAQEIVGYAYFSGSRVIGIEQDLVKAIGWLRKAADQNSSQAQLYLGRAYAFGIGVPQDKALAAALYRRAGEGGNGEAAYELAQAHYRGEGVTEDWTEAFKWAARASSKGLLKAGYMASVLANRNAERPEGILWANQVEIRSDGNDDAILLRRLLERDIASRGKLERIRQMAQGVLFEWVAPDRDQERLLARFPKEMKPDGPWCRALSTLASSGAYRLPKEGMESIEAIYGFDLRSLEKLSNFQMCAALVLGRRPRGEVFLEQIRRGINCAQEVRQACTAMDFPFGSPTGMAGDLKGCEAARLGQQVYEKMNGKLAMVAGVDELLAYTALTEEFRTFERFYYVQTSQLDRARDYAQRQVSQLLEPYLHYDPCQEPFRKIFTAFYDIARFGQGPEAAPSGLFFPPLLAEFGGTLDAIELRDAHTEVELRKAARKSAANSELVDNMRLGAKASMAASGCRSIHGNISVLPTSLLDGGQVRHVDLMIGTGSYLAIAKPTLAFKEAADAIHRAAGLIHELRHLSEGFCPYFNPVTPEGMVKRGGMGTSPPSRDHVPCYFPEQVSLPGGVYFPEGEAFLCDSSFNGWAGGANSWHAMYLDRVARHKDATAVERLAARYILKEFLLMRFLRPPTIDELMEAMPGLPRGSAADYLSLVMRSADP